MPFWRGETLVQRLPRLIDPFDATAVDCAAYTLHMGKEIYISPDSAVKSRNRQTKEVLSPEQGFAIPPGQFAFLLTEETVTVPDNALAFISIKASVKFNGLINISGFHADPGYTGKLLFSVLNAGPKPLHLRQGQPLFLIWYADLDGKTMKKKTEQGLDHIEPRLINNISGEILSLQNLSERQRQLESKMEYHESLMKYFKYAKWAIVAALIGAAVSWPGPMILESISGARFFGTTSSVSRVGASADAKTVRNGNALPLTSYVGHYGPP